MLPLATFSGGTPLAHIFLCGGVGSDMECVGMATDSSTPSALALMICNDEGEKVGGWRVCGEGLGGKGVEEEQWWYSAYTAQRLP